MIDVNMNKHMMIKQDDFPFASLSHGLVTYSGASVGLAIDQN